MRVLVVIPTYNEADNIADVMSQVLDLPMAPEILVVDDSSTDGTSGLVVAARTASGGRVHLLTRPGKSGLGTAYVEAFRWAVAAERYDVVVQMDADGSHRPSDIPRLLEALPGAGLAIGSRYVPGGRVCDWPRRRRVLSRAGNLYARSVLGVPIADLTGGFKAWSTPLLGHLDWSGCGATGYAFQIQTTVQALALGAAATEVPIMFRDRQLGQSKMSRAIVVEALREVRRLRRRHGPAVGATPRSWPAAVGTEPVAA